ncbi:MULTISPECIES: RadC family protein [unclassified Asaia]|uniref:JAB domain-containing protein n=1 Tax=unclassified Asaia TaxID=2685023 RepID=UPI001F35612D|nr:DNA repair protein RadC [Asaia sp. W19]
MKEVNDISGSGKQDVATSARDSDPAAPNWVEIPPRALIAGQGQVLSDEVLLRLFAESLGVIGEEAQILVDAFLIRFGSLAAIFATEDRALNGILHIGPQIRVAIRLVQEAAIRLSRARMGRDDIFTNRKLMVDYLVSRLAREPVEQFRILFLDERNRLLADEAQTRGTVNHTPVYPREVARRAMELGARSIILVHNHPSGDPTPSEADIAMTLDAQRAAALIEVRIADHFIIGNGAYVSFRDLRLLRDL